MNVSTRVLGSYQPAPKTVAELKPGDEVLVGKSELLGTIMGVARGGAVLCSIPRMGQPAITIPVEWVKAWWDGAVWVKVA